MVYAAPVTVSCSNTGAVTGGLLGALAGGLLGSSVAGYGNRTEGGIVGALAGGGLGAVVGHAHDRHQCDQQGAYWAYADTAPYAAGAAPDAYGGQGCRMAQAAVGNQTQYVRVCPDGSGRYRIVN
jgi:hypothetical protein